MSDDDPYDKLRLLQEGVDEVQKELEDLRQLREEVQELRQLREEVAELRSDVDDLEVKEERRDASVRDHYDATVLDLMEEDRSYSKRQMRQFYERAGVRDTGKIKARVQHLRRAGVLENDGKKLRLSG